MKKIFLIILFGLSFFSHNLFAVPAYPYPGIFIQPNGEEIPVRMRGDEHHNWVESEDGYTLLYNEEQFLVYAETNEKGAIISSGIIAQPVKKRSMKVIELLKKTPKHLQPYSPVERKNLQSLQSSMQAFSSGNPFKTTAEGKTQAICVLMEFPDKPFTHMREAFEQLMNQPDYGNGKQTGSVSDFYRQNSYGKLDLEFTVIGPVLAKNEWAYYGKNNRQGNDQNVDQLIQEAQNAILAIPNIHLPDYDDNGDGQVDILHVFYAGFGEEANGGNDCIWAQSVPFLFSCSPELRDNATGNPNSEMSYIGVVCHELGHVLGSPDYYDADGSGSGGNYIGTGKWDLMANGSWNNNGATPAYMNMPQKIYFGWVNPVELTDNLEIKDMPNSAENPVAYLLLTEKSNEYYVLENRQEVGFDKDVPGSGLLIYHVTENSNQFQPNCGHPQGVYPVCAASSYEIPTGTISSYGSINSSGCTFPRSGLIARNSFSGNSIPAAFMWDDSAKLEQSITDITQSGGLISFNFSTSSTLLQLKASVDRQTVTLNWETPETEKEIKGYNIYRDNRLLLFSTQNFYRETLRTGGDYVYGVSVVYIDSESPVEKIDVHINNTGIERLENPLSPSEMSVYTPSGKLVFHAKICAGENQPEVRLPQGIYILKLKGKDRISTSKFVIQ